MTLCIVTPPPPPRLPPRRSDLGTARDMAQALLLAAAEDDSAHQLLLMRPGPLAALLASWYQQRGPLTIAPSVTLLEALAASGQLDQLQQVSTAGQRRWARSRA